MFGEGESCRAISLQVVALLAAIQVGNAGELAHVLVLVAIHALRELHPVKGVLALGNMALRALHCGVLLH